MLRIKGKHLADTLAAIDELEFGLPKNLRVDASNNETMRRKKQRLEPEQRIQLRHNLVNDQISMEESQNAVEQYAAWISQLLLRVSKCQADLRQEMKLDQERRQILDNLTKQDQALKGEETEIQYRIKLRKYAIDLLQGAMRHLSRRFNHHLRGLAGRTLPMFTENRYQHLQIDDDLTVRAFSSEKRDFMELDEVSSGTQRQIMLALRLSMSQQLVSRVVRGHQFIFLDEPFAFFDEQRTKSALAVLPHLSNDITQIWIVAQEFPTDLTFAKTIRCCRDVNEYQDSVLSS
jgi:exonuclease SbcC